MVKIKNFSIDTLPHKLRIKLPIQQLYNNITTDIFDECDKKLKDIII